MMKIPNSKKASQLPNCILCTSIFFLAVGVFIVRVYHIVAGDAMGFQTYLTKIVYSNLR